MCFSWGRGERSGGYPAGAGRGLPGANLGRAASDPDKRLATGAVLPMSAVAPVAATRMRSQPGEHGVDGEGVAHRGIAELIPGKAEVGPVDVDLRVEPCFAVPVDRCRGIEGQGPGTVAHGQRAGHGDTLTRRPDTVRGEGDVRMVA